MGVKDWLKTKAAGGGGNYFTDGRGRVILKDAKLIKGFEDPQTFIMEVVVKSSFPVRDDAKPNAVGTTVSFVKKMTKVLGDDARAKAAVLAILGREESDGDDVLEKEFNELLRIGPDGYTLKGSTCPMRGVELSYETRRQFTRDGKTELVVPRFERVPFDEKTVLENQKFLDTGITPGGLPATGT